MIIDSVLLLKNEHRHAATHDKDVAIAKLCKISPQIYIFFVKEYYFFVFIFLKNMVCTRGVESNSKCKISKNVRKNNFLEYQN